MSPKTILTAFLLLGVVFASISGKTTLPACTLAPTLFDNGQRPIPSVFVGLAFTPNGKNVLAHESMDDGKAYRLELIDIERASSLLLPFPDKLRAQVPKVRLVGLAPSRNATLFDDGAGALAVADVTTGNILYSVNAPDRSVIAADLSADGNTLGIVGAAGTLQVWDLRSNAILHTCMLKSLPALLSVSPDGKSLIAGCFRNSKADPNASSMAEAWNISEHKLVKQLTSHARPITSICFSPDGKMAASTSVDGTLRLWNTATWKQHAVLEWTAPPTAVPKLQTIDRAILQAVFTPDNRYILSTSVSKLLLWEIASGKAALTFEGDPADMRHISISPDGTRAVSSSSNTIVLWDLRSGEEIRTLVGGMIKGPTIDSIKFLPDSSRLVACAERHGPIWNVAPEWDATIWDVASGKPIRTIENAMFAGQCFSSDGKYGLSSQQVGLWDFSKAPPIWSRKKNYYPTALSPDGRFAALGETRLGDGIIHVVDVQADKPMHTIVMRDAAAFHSLAISSNNRFLAAKTFVGTVGVWDLMKGDLLHVLDDPVPVEQPLSNPGYVSFLPDGKGLTSQHYVIRRWDAATGRPIEVLNYLPNNRLPKAFNQDGTACAYVDSASFRLVEIWDIAKGKELRTFLAGKGPSRQIRAIAFAPNGRWVAAGGQGQLLCIWDLKNGRLLHDLVAK